MALWILAEQTYTALIIRILGPLPKWKSSGADSTAGTANLLSDTSSSHLSSRHRRSWSMQPVDAAASAP